MRQISDRDVRATEDFFAQTVPRIMRDEGLREARAALDGVTYSVTRRGDGSIEIAQMGSARSSWRTPPPPTQPRSAR